MVAHKGLYGDNEMLNCITALVHTDFIELMGRLCTALVTPADDNSWGIFLVYEFL